MTYDQSTLVNKPEHKKHINRQTAVTYQKYVIHIFKTSDNC